MDFDDDEEKIAREKRRRKKFPIQLYISEGNYYFKLRKYDLAIECFNKGIEVEPVNEKCLIGRSKCYMRLSKYTEAREDAETVLKSHPKSAEAVMLKGEADYFLGDFERAFLTFHRGYSSRRNHDGLRCGYQMCEKAIENALNPDVPIVIDEEDLRNVYELKEKDEQPSKSGQYSVDIDFVTSLLQDDSKKLSKRMHYDLNELSEKTMESVHQDCEFVKDYLTDREMFWHTQNPKTSKKGIIDSFKEDVDGKAESNIRVPDSYGEDDEDSFCESKLKTSKKSSIASILKKLIESIEATTEDNFREADSYVSDEEVSSSVSNLDASKNDNTNFIEEEPEDNNHDPDSRLADEKVFDSSKNNSTDNNSEKTENPFHDPDPHVADEKILDSSKNNSTGFIVEAEDNIHDPDSYVTVEEFSSSEPNSNATERSSADSNAEEIYKNIEENSEENIHEPYSSRADDEDKVSKN